MIPFIRLFALVVALTSAVSQAWAEEEVRIAIASSGGSIRLSGLRLGVYDGDGGERIAAYAEQGVVDVELDGDVVRVTHNGKKLGRAARVLVQAADVVRVDKGLYLGRVELVKHKGRLLAINRLPLETYLLGIVGSEMSPAWPIESLKAQAVAARTYALQRRMMMRAANRAYDLESSVLSQVYKGAERIRPSVVRAVRETRGQVIAYEYDLVEALFHSTCGGHTVSAKSVFGNDVPYLRPASCGYCDDSSKHRWRVALSLDEVSQRLQRARLIRGRLKELDRSAKARLVSARDRRGRQALSAKKVRAAMGYTVLYSNRFAAHTRRGKVHFEGRGFGHGVGMCQWGARGMATRGKSHKEILEHYYRGAQVRRIY